MTDVACLAATIAAVAEVTMTSTLRRTNSAAISSKRSVRPSAQRYSIATVRPSIQLSSCNRRTKAATHWPWDEGVPATSNPMIGSFADCCARAASGHAAAPPSSDMNARRLMGRTPPRLRAARYHTVAPERRCASQQKLRADVADGSDPVIRQCRLDVRFARKRPRLGDYEFTPYLHVRSVTCFPRSLSLDARRRIL